MRGVRESHLHIMLQKVEISFKKIKQNMQAGNFGKQDKHAVKREAIELTQHPDCSIGNDSPSSTIIHADSDVSETSTTFVIELGRNEIEKNGALRRYQDLEKWIWTECLSSSMLHAIEDGKKRCRQLLDICDYCLSIYTTEENHCPSCHRTSEASESGFNFSEHVAECKRKLKLDQHCTLHGSYPAPLRVRMLKMLLALIEVTTSTYLRNEHFISPIYLISHPCSLCFL